MTTTPPKRAPGRRAARESAPTYAMMGVSDRIDRVIAVFGADLAARALRVNRSQPSRWRAGRERVSSENLATLIELDHVASRLLTLLHPDAIPLWLDGENPFLNGRPKHVLLLSGPRALQIALDGEESGGYG